MATYKIGSNSTPGNDDALKKVAATFDAAMSRALSGFKEAAHPGNFKVLAVTDNTKDQKIADVKATGDQEAVKRLNDPNLADISNTGVPLANIASITKISDNVLELKTRDGKDIIIIKQMTPYLFDGMAGKVDAVDALNKSKADGYRIAQAGDTAPGLDTYKAIGPADEVGPGMIRYETLSGDKVVVSKETNSDLYEKVKSDRETWGLINDSKNEGYRLAGADEAGSVSLVGTPEELGHGLIRYETASGDKIIVSQAISPDLYASVVKESNGIFGVDGAVDTHWIDNSKYASAKDWDKIVGNTSGTPTQEERDLDRPRAASKMLSDNWDKWGLHDRPIDFSNPPADLPPEAQACLKYLAGSPSLMNALDSGGLGKSDGVITHADVDKFISQSNKDLSAASKSYGTFLSKNPDATGLAKENAKSAAIVMANISLVSSAGPEMQGPNQRANNGSLNTANLKAIKDDSGLSPELTGAAGYWSTPGMLRTLDMAGDLPATAKADGITQQKNLGAWLENQAPKDDHGVLMMLSNAAVRSSVADVDTSKLTKDVLEHPENYDGKTKAAVMMEISDARARMAASDKVGDGDLYAGITADTEYHLNPTKSKVTDQLDAAIGKLSSDPDVKTFLSLTRPRAPGSNDESPSPCTSRPNSRLPPAARQSPDSRGLRAVTAKRQCVRWVSGHRARHRYGSGFPAGSSVLQATACPVQARVQAPANKPAPPADDDNGQSSSLWQCCSARRAVHATALPAPVCRVHKGRCPAPCRPHSRHCAAAVAANSPASGDGRYTDCERRCAAAMCWTVMTTQEPSMPCSMA